MMLVVVAIMKAKEGMEQEFEQALKSIIPQVETEKRNTHVYASPAQERSGKIPFL